MRKILLSLLLIIFLDPIFSNAQGIGQLGIYPNKPASGNSLMVIASVTIPSQPAYRISNSSRISHDTLYLEACYYSGIAGAPTQLTDTISIGSPPPGIHTFHFKIFTSLSTTQCTKTGSAVKIQPFAISAPLGIKPVAEKPEIAFYPNPAHEFLIVKNKDVQSLIIRDLSGKTVLQRSFSKEPKQKIDVRSFPKGLYLIALVTKNEEAYYQRILIE